MAVEDQRQRNVLLEVAKRLSMLSESGEKPLVAERLRGGMPLENEWVRTPAQPTILCSTVDQVGSRLLFRGYGVSQRMAPVHAGLLGENSLILIDEAHIARPLRQTVSAIRKLGRANVKVALLSATAGVDSASVFRMTKEDRTHTLLRRRIATDKFARIERMRSGDDPANVLADKALAMMRALLEADVGPPAVGVVVNRVAIARGTFELLAACQEDFEVVLMIGRCRAVERDRIAGKKLAPFKTGAPDRAGARPLILVATQCIEVGVDLDLDGLVTQAAPLDALRQRAGRLNRDGRCLPAEARVLALPDDLAKRKDDPVYGDRIRATWSWLEDIARDDVVNFGIEALDRQLELIDVGELSSPRNSAPVLMPAYLDLWAQTAPVPAADPSVELFLHGKQPPTPDVSLVWRGDIGLDDLSDRNTEDLVELFSLAPPRAGETVQVPLWALRSLWDLDVGEADELADVSAPAQSIDRRRSFPNDNSVAFRWAGRGDSRTGVVGPADVRPGDVLILPSEVGGCDEFGWSPTDRSVVVDVGDEAAKPGSRHRLAIRIGRDVVREDKDWARLTTVLAEGDDRDRDGLLTKLLDALPEQAEVTSGGNAAERATRSVRGMLERAQVLAGRLDVHRPYPDASLSSGGAVLVVTFSRKVWQASLPATEDDYLSNTASSNVYLNAHGEQVACIARAWAKKLGLDELVEDIALAAYLHDAGKADRRFQAMLVGGDEWNVPDGPALAKSRRWVPGAHRRAGLPNGWRHEAQSVRLCIAHPRFREARDRELVLWLVGTHHGLGRPFFGFAEDEHDSNIKPCLSVERWADLPEVGPQSLAFNHDGKGWSDLFESLKRRYGIWRLANLEAILRLADHRASEGVQAR